MNIEQLISYDKYIFQFSGGKDSVATFLYLLELGIDKTKIEIWHQDIDGEVLPGENYFMDWPVTKAYVKAFAQTFGVPVFFSWREGGFKREMLRNNEFTGRIFFENEKKELIRLKNRTAKKYLNTRMKFPQVSADLSVRWCSAYLKIDVAAAAIRNQKRFQGIKTLVITGERGEESSARAKYKIFEPHRSDLRKGKVKRHVDHFRPIRDWNEKKVWEIIERFRVRPHPAYLMGFSRVSCMKCIFGNADQFASVNLIDPCGTKIIAEFEVQFGITIKRNESVYQLIEKGTPYKTITRDLAQMAMKRVYDLQIILPEEEKWVLPSGAFGDSCGPT